MNKGKKSLVAASRTGTKPLLRHKGAEPFGLTLMKKW